MKFYILSEDYCCRPPDSKAGLRGLYEGTSVAEYKKWFFSSLGRFGRIIPIGMTEKENTIARVLDRPDTIFLSANIASASIDWSMIPHRLLQLSLGSLLLPQHLFEARSLATAQVQLVSTDFQRDQIISYVRNAAPRMEVFPPRVDTDFYIPPRGHERLRARRKQGLAKKNIHIVYAGRLIVTKGICQLIRILDRWPIPNVVLTLVGDIEQDNKVGFSLAQHKNFAYFLEDEILRQRPRPWLRFQQPKQRCDLRELFWSADLFVNPSIQPDENFGITPRQAAACGVPVVTTDFCGLRPLAENMPWKGAHTYPTIAGSRFSLKGFRELLERALIEKSLLTPADYHAAVAQECNADGSLKNLESALHYLRQRPTEKMLRRKNSEADIKRHLFRCVATEAFARYLQLRKAAPRGAGVYGDTPFDPAFAIVQGIYSFLSSPPIVERNTPWSGFFRIAFWDKESTLVEFGFPGPRICRYPKTLWRSLSSCIRRLEQDEYAVIPKNKTQVAIVQELADLGYLVPG